MRYANDPSSVAHIAGLRRVDEIRTTIYGG